MYETEKIPAVKDLLEKKCNCGALISLRRHHCSGICKKCYGEKYYQEHREEKKAYDRKRYQERKERYKEYYQEHREEIKAYSRKYYQENKRNASCAREQILELFNVEA